jgi:ABC-type phosphate transport system substrate-binding protein
MNFDVKTFKLRRVAAVSLIVSSLAITFDAFADDIVIIVNRDNMNVVDAAFVQRVYVGTIKGWPDGTKVLVLDQPEGSDAREAFCATVLKKSVNNVKAIWSQNIFTGKALPPKITTPDLAIKQTVASNIGAIGYIHASQIDATVKVLGK